MISFWLQNFVGFLKASRVPNLIVIALAQILAARFLIVEPISFFDIRFLALVVSTTMVAAGGYIINDYYDQKIDMVNRPDKVVVGVGLKRRMALFSHFSLTIGAILVGLYSSWVVAVIHTFSVFCLWYYSNHLRRLPFLGNLVIASMTGLTLVLISIYTQRNQDLITIYAFFAFLIMLIREVIKDIEDVKGEAAFGCITIPVVWGVRGAKFTIYIIALIGVTLLGSFLMVQENWMLRGFFLMLTPVFVWFLYRLAQADRHDEFTFLKNFTNLLMLLGLASIILI
ncbi:MAG: geranylgeranylglycerol-phosphate geranylgeranyltransferase [Cyclobacteriaceae bacterium]|nr:geranylgeranylglycerol-phosphate geranylgeranyltransferase [Cyclobacteriaceae bacterium HetDA_MAG_MS6]